MKRGIDAGEIVESELDGDVQYSTKVGECLLDWAQAYANTSGNQRSCWQGKKRMVCMTWRDTDSSDEEEED